MQKEGRIAATARLFALVVVLVAGGPTAVGAPRREAVVPCAAAHATAPSSAPARIAFAPSWLVAREPGTVTRPDAACRDFVPADAAALLSPRAVGPPGPGPARAARYVAPSVTFAFGRAPPSRV